MYIAIFFQKPLSSLPYALVRYQSSSRYLPRPLRVSLKDTFNLDELLPQPAQPEPFHPRLGRLQSDKRQRCHFCPSKSTWSGKIKCNGTNCGKPICNDHSVVIYKDCFVSVHICFFICIS